MISLDRDFDRREEYQAATLAARFASRPDIRMVVHAGHGHIFKHEVRNVGRYMAARLWEKTGVEPFTIWQLSNELPNDVYRRSDPPDRSDHGAGDAGPATSARDGSALSRSRQCNPPSMPS